MIPQAIANECNATYVKLNGCELLAKSRDIMEARAHIQEKFALAHKLSLSGSCVLFIDDLDSIASSFPSTSIFFYNIILAEIDSLYASRKRIFVIASTSRPDKIDGSILRPGRLCRLVYVPLPDLYVCTLQCSLNKTPLNKGTADTPLLVPPFALSHEKMSITSPLFGGG